MSRLMIFTAAVLLLFAVSQDAAKRIETVFDAHKNVTTVRLPSSQVSGAKDRYHSLSYSIYYSYPGREPASPRDVNFELRSVVKARKLSTDLYVVFVVDGKEIHFGSSRSAIRNPVRGKPWIGERMVFHVPREDFLKLAAAEKLGVKLGGVTFDFNEDVRDAVRAFAKTLNE
jgi:hypothetical protein